MDLSSTQGLYTNIFGENCKAGTIVKEEQSNKPKLCKEEAISLLLGAPKEGMPEVSTLLFVNK